MKAKRKGAHGELKAKWLLEAAGYTVVKAGGSFGCFDLIALGPVDIRAIQVKCGDRNYCSSLEREAMRLAVLPPNSSREIWRWRDYARAPLIEVLR